jgi:hypothetical protein
MSQNVVPLGGDSVFAYHPDGMDLTGLYQAYSYQFDDGTSIAVPACDVVQTPHDFIYAYDDLGRRLDPRRFAGEGGTPLDPARAAQTAPRAAAPLPPRLVPRLVAEPAPAPAPESPA